MKITIQVSEKYKLLILKDELPRFQKNYKPGDILSGNLIKKRDVRSIRQLHTYWVLMRWCESNCPEWVQKVYSKYLGIEHITSEAWHNICKSYAKVNSIAFDNMDNTEMYEYFLIVMAYIKKLFGIASEVDLLEVIKNET